jgi:hypothetical protein
MQKPLPGQFRTCSGTPAGSPDGRQSSTNVPINWSRAWCSGPLPPARRNFPISVRDVRPPELAFGWCSTIATPDRGSRTSRQTSPLALSYRTLAAMPFQPTGHRRVPGGRDRARPDPRTTLSSACRTLFTMSATPFGRRPEPDQAPPDRRRKGLST